MHQFRTYDFFISASLLKIHTQRQCRDIFLWYSGAIFQFNITVFMDYLDIGSPAYQNNIQDGGCLGVAMGGALDNLQQKLFFRVLI